MGYSENNQHQTKISLFFALILFFVAFSGVACHLIKKPETVTGNSEHLLQANQVATDSVGIEIFTIRISPQQQDLIRQLWLEVDEQVIAPPLRRELAEQGFRIGLLGDLLTPSLSQLINVTGNSLSGNTNDFQEVAIANLPRDPAVTRQYRNLLPDMRASLKAFDDPVPELSRFWTENGQLCGQTLKDALGLICVTARTQSNGTVRFDIVPELEYGTTERRFRIHSAMMIPEEGRPRLPFTSLTITQNLLPGQWILIGPAFPNCIGIARAFFIRGTEEPEQKMLAIRLIKMRKGVSESGGSNIPAPEKDTDFSFQERN